MPTLISAGVSVTVTDESMFIPTSAPTVPLIFIATQDEKMQSDGITPAEGTYEYHTVRTITSLRQSTQMYGIPSFLESNQGPHHGDARNEYGVFALNQFLGIGNRAYVVRANINLNDNIDDLRVMWDRKILEASTYLEFLIQDYIDNYNATNGLVPTGSPAAITSVDSATYLTLVATAIEDIFNSYSFSSLESYFINDQSLDPLPIYANGYSSAVTGYYYGLTYIAENLSTYGGSPYGGSPYLSLELTPTGGADLLVAAADDFKYTLVYNTETRLGMNDTQRRAAIVTALQAAIVSNTEIRSDNFDYNLILCPGYPEVGDEIVALIADIQEEALGIIDTPMNKDPDGITNASTGWAITAERQRSSNVAYYYPSAHFATNLDGKNIVAAGSGSALRTYTYSDNVAFLWEAPAGTRRGIMTGISNLGYVSGVLGGPTTFVEVNLNKGQMDALYGYNTFGDINPMVYMPGQGFVIMGQKTSATTASAMDRVNVSRLVKYIKRQLRKNTLSFLFEPNDQLTRDNLKATVDNFLGDLVVKRGLYDFATVCDASNNTSDRIDRNEMYIDIFIKPVKAAEFIYIPIRVVSSGAEI